MAEIVKIEEKRKKLSERKKVAAYARVSTSKEKQENSLAVQISYYSRLIQDNPEWDYAGVYSDDGISGTSMLKRHGFQDMMRDAENGKIDIILTKSISRFARNTVDLLESVRKLKDLGIDVRFEKENIRSLSEDGELMLTLLASFAQAESESLSANIRWARRKRFEQGLPHAHYHIYGYRWEGDDLKVVPEEAEVVKLIYNNYLNGISPEKTERQLEENGIKNTQGRHFTGEMIRLILINVVYTGNMLLQRFYSEESFPHKMHKNNGEVQQYYVENSHEAIIPMEIFRKVQDEIARREKEGYASIPGTRTSCFTGKIRCGCCGHNYTRTSRNDGQGKYFVWRCSTKNRKGAAKCGGRRIRENILKDCCAKVMGTDEFDAEKFNIEIEYIVISDDTLDFFWKDGREEKTEWHPILPKETWTAERREKKGQVMKKLWTDERRRKQSEAMKKFWKERKNGGKEESCKDTGNQE